MTPIETLLLAWLLEQRRHDIAKVKATERLIAALNGANVAPDEKIVYNDNSDCASVTQPPSFK